MSEPTPLETVFFAALAQAPAQRAAFLTQACAGDENLRSRVERMLAAQAEAGSFLESPPSAVVGTDHATIDQPLAERPGTQIGPYKLLEQIGEGGFGVVFMAEQFEPVRRRVALKVIKPGMDTRQVIARFEAERQALAVMDHPNIARVLDGGATESGRPYFVMELVRGTPITQYCDENSLPIRERLALFAAVCQTIQHAHTKGIIHRDIKPTNVLVTRQDGQPVVKVIDFGIAKAMGQQLTDKTLFTEFAQMIGTPLYMSPEQAELSSTDIDTRSDIYSLGVLLYELLTGSTPVSKEQLKQAAFDEIRRIIREDEPPKPSTRLSSVGSAHDRTPREVEVGSAHPTLASIAAVRSTEPAKLTRLVRGELDWIVMKCLDKDRNRRYETAASLATDVKRFLSDEPVLACPPSTLYRLRKLARRHKGALLSLSAVALAALLSVAALAVSTGRVWQANQDLRTEVYFQRITVAHRELSTDNLAAALRALEECPEDLRGWEWHYLMRLCKVEPLVIPVKTEVNGVAFSPDGERIASAGQDGKIKIWDSRSGKLLLEIPGAHDKGACSVAFHPHGRHLASAGADRLVKVWDLETSQAVFQGPCDAIRKFGASCTVAFRPRDGRYLAAGCNGIVRVWDWKKNRPEAPEHTFRGPEHDSIPVAFTRDGQRLAAGLILWDAETRLRSFPTDGHPVTSLAFSMDGGRLVAASLGRSVSLWDTTTGKQRYSRRQDGNVLGVAFCPDGRRFASSGEDKAVHIWDAVKGREVLGLRGHNEMCGCVVFSPDGHRLASASHDGTIRVWDATPLAGDEGQETLNFDEHDHEVRCVALSSDGRRVASAGNGTLVKIWDAVTGRVHFDFPGHSAPVFSMAWHPDGRRIATAGSPGRQNVVKVWDARTGEDAFPPISAGRDSSAGPYQVVAFCPDGRYLVTGKQDGAVQVWDARTGQEVGTLGTHEREIRAVVFSPDGKHLATASGDGEVRLWDANRLDQNQQPRLPPLRARVPGPSVNVAFSPDGRRLATGAEENTVKIWDVEQGGEPLLTLRGHGREVYAVAFSPSNDGQWIATGGEDSRVMIWDSRTGELVHTFRGHTNLISSLTFSPDGKRLYSGSRDTTVKVWDVTQIGRIDHPSSRIRPTTR